MKRKRKPRDVTPGPYTRTLNATESDDRASAYIVPVSGRLLVLRDSGAKTPPLTKDTTYE